MDANVILIDAGYIDRLAAEFQQHYSQQLGREVPKADLAQWLIYLSLDAEMVSPEEKGNVQVFLLYERDEKIASHIAPCNLPELDGMAFQAEPFGEFSIACCPVERITTLSDLCAESLEALLEDKSVKRIATVFDFDGTTATSRDLTKRIVRISTKHAATEEPKDITLFTMRPLEDEGIVQQNTGFSLLAALGISSDEL